MFDRLSVTLKDWLFPPLTNNLKHIITKLIKVHHHHFRNLKDQITLLYVVKAVSDKAAQKRLPVKRISSLYFFPFRYLYAFRFTH